MVDELNGPSNMPMGGLAVKVAAFWFYGRQCVIWLHALLGREKPLPYLWIMRHSTCSNAFKPKLSIETITSIELCCTLGRFAALGEAVGEATPMAMGFVDNPRSPSHPPRFRLEPHLSVESL